MLLVKQQRSLKRSKGHKASNKQVSKKEVGLVVLADLSFMSQIKHYNTIHEIHMAALAARTESMLVRHR